MSTTRKVLLPRTHAKYPLGTAYHYFATATYLCYLCGYSYRAKAPLLSAIQPRTKSPNVCDRHFLPPMPASLKDPLQTMYLNGFGGHAPPVVSFSHACTPFAQRFAHTSAYPAPLSIQDGCVRYMHPLRKCTFSAFIPAYNTPLSNL